MKQMDVLIAHPQKHHVYHLAAGCQRSGLSTRLIVPLYRKGLAAVLAAVPGPIGRKAQGYHLGAIESSSVISPIVWQARRLLIPSTRFPSFERLFDLYVARRIRVGDLHPQVLVTMQDYMPATVAAGKEIGAIIWSDQISNRSAVARERINGHMSAFGIRSSDETDERRNDAILASADIITLPSAYAFSGVATRISARAQVHRVPYGVSARQFATCGARSAHMVRVLARANTVQKGGHLLLSAIGRCGAHLRELANGSPVEFVIVGALESQLQAMLDGIDLPEGVSVRSVVVPHVDMPKLLASAHLFVMPSLSEGMSLICVEAMQMGLPIVITSFCGIDCFQNFEMGVQVTDDVASLTEGLVTAFSKRADWPIWGAAAREKASQLTWESYETSIAAIAGALI
jgi:glycosyltransferase involved in cell wall biosynthesis